jgi:hypothetical protein
MIGHDSHIGYLTDLPQLQRDAELTQEVTDSLQDLVACIERLLPSAGNTLHSCVIDDFQIVFSELRAQDCRVVLRFSASVRQGMGSAARLDSLTGRAEAVIDERGRVTYCDVRFADEPAYVAHDLGGGD